MVCRVFFIWVVVASLFSSFVRCEPPIHKHGYWEGICGHCYDDNLASSIIEYFKANDIKTVADFGCGDGSYIRTFLNAGFTVNGFDGNPKTPEMTDHLASVLDLAVVQDLGKKWDYIVSLEVGEHLPREFGDKFIENLHRHNRKGIILSWAVPGQPGHGHFNCRSNKYIKRKFEKLGYRNNIEAENVLRLNSTLWWFKNTVMVFERE